MDDLRELYQQVILDHNKSPRNYGELASANRSAEGYNPLCGDRMQIYAFVDEGVIKDVSFTGSGCAIFKASASLMTAEIKGKTVAAAQILFKQFQQLITSEVGQKVEAGKWGKLAVFSGVREFPMRIKCASLSWHALMSALQQDQKVVSTEA